ncbi:hypothetical protein [Xanthocytophaga agilis]|uniref:Uncharacterized protein n=1 Tax=Xanthocytophaga agilis TaxID=3048010 RepID=A0AAE3R7G9_9BACT|nr:hypothetical protein [Xanthocytophaga agilis]MDJ1505241.1 hypothetical protein [Xanthocytophaga agilis]
MRLYITFPYSMWAILFLTGVLTSCKKETEYAPYPYSSITAFEIPTGANSIQAAVSDNRLTVYWPYYQMIPDSIAPVVSVSERATVEPASGKKIPLKDGVTYIVKAESGATTTYTLKLVINQAEPIFDQVPATIPLYSQFSLTGQNFLADTAKTSLLLVSSTGTQYPIALTALTGNSASGTAIHAQLDTGNYSIKLVTGYRSVTSNAMVHITSPVTNPYFDPFIESGTRVKRGSSLTLKTHNLEGYTITQIRLGTLTTRVPFEQTGEDELTLQIPESYPIGSYNRFRIYYSGSASAGNYYSFLLYPITITE